MNIYLCHYFKDGKLKLRLFSNIPSGVTDGYYCDEDLEAYDLSYYKHIVVVDYEQIQDLEDNGQLELYLINLLNKFAGERIEMEFKLQKRKLLEFLDGALK